MSAGLHTSHVSNLELLARGKVRDVYAVDDEHLLIVATDRLSAFDVVLSQPIPGKGQVLTRVSNFWFDQIVEGVATQASALGIEDVVDDPAERVPLVDRAVVVKRCRPLPVEAIVRGYIIGSGWKDYQSSGAISGVALPDNLRIAEQLPEPIFTPSTKALQGEHDENIAYADMCTKVGVEMAEAVREHSVRLYRAAAKHALARGLIIADTKFEFGLDAGGNLTLIDEILTPDSSRFWPADAHQPGENPPSFDKQFVRDYLETLPWDKTAPAPELPAEIIARTAAKYAEAERRLTAP